MKIFSLAIFFWSHLYTSSAFAIIWKNLDVNVELFFDKSAQVKEKHDLVFEEGDQRIILPFYVGEQQSIILKKIELVDIIKNLALPVNPLPPPPSAKKSTTTTAITPAIYYTYSAQNILTIDLPFTLGKTYNLSIEYEIKGALKAFQKELHLKYAWAHPRRNGVIRYFSFNLTPPAEWTAIEGVSKNITRENMGLNDQFVTDLHLRSIHSTDKGPKALVELDEIFSCQLESNLPEKLFSAYLPDLPPTKIDFPLSFPVSFRLKGTHDGTVTLQNIGVELNFSFSLSEEQKTSFGPKNIAFFNSRFETEKVRIESKLKNIIHAILFATINLYSKKEVDNGKTTHLVNPVTNAPAKNFEVTVLEESLIIMAGSLKLSLRTPVIGEIESIKMLTSSPAGLLSDTDISSIALTFSLNGCKKI